MKGLYVEMQLQFCLWHEGNVLINVHTCNNAARTSRGRVPQKRNNTGQKKQGPQMQGVSTDVLVLLI